MYENTSKFKKMRNLKHFWSQAFQVRCSTCMHLISYPLYNIKLDPLLILPLQSTPNSVWKLLAPKCLISFPPLWSMMFFRHRQPQCQHLESARPARGWLLWTAFLQGSRPCQEHGKVRDSKWTLKLDLGAIRQAWVNYPLVCKACGPQSSWGTLGQLCITHLPGRGLGQVRLANSWEDLWEQMSWVSSPWAAICFLPGENMLPMRTAE